MKRLRAVISLILSIFGVVILSVCTGGNDSGIDNIMITGKLFEPDGVTPAKGAYVVVRYKNTLPSIQGNGNDTTGTLYSTFTDANGIFLIDTLHDGLYIVEGSDQNGNMALYDSIDITSPPAPLQLPDDTLKPAGKVAGIIKLPVGENPLQVFVLAFGVDRFCQVQQNGSFSFEGLAEGTYHFKILSLEPRVQAVDTSGVGVKSGELTWLDTITLSENGLLPTPRNFTAVFDSGRLETRLSWDATPAAFTKGYNIYRKSENGGFWTPEPAEGIRLNDTLIVHPAFIDNTIRYGYLYTNFDPGVRYYVTMVDTGGMESLGGKELSVNITTKWEWVDSASLAINNFPEVQKVFVDDNNIVHMFASRTFQSRRYYRFNSNGENLTTWPVPVSITAEGNCYLLDIGKNDGIWLWTVNNDTTARPCHATLYKLTADGETENRIVLDSILELLNPIRGIDFHCQSILDDSLLICSIGHELVMVNLNDTTLKTLCSLDSGSYELPVAVQNTENKLFLCLKNIGHDRFIEITRDGEVLPEITNLDFENAHGDLIGIRKKADGSRLIYYADEYYSCTSGGAISKETMPYYSLPNSIRLVMKDGSVIILVHGEVQSKTYSYSVRKTMLFRFKNRTD